MLVLDYDRAREITGKRQKIEREKEIRRRSQVTRLEDVFAQAEAGNLGRLFLILKGDTDGSVQALADELERLSTDEVEVRVVHRGVGAINESDVLLAQATEAIIIGFHVQIGPRAKEALEHDPVDVRQYRIIYDAVDDMKKALEGVLESKKKKNFQSESIKHYQN